MDLVKIERTPNIAPAKDYGLNLHEGIREIQKLSGAVWTHFNESDPGVTVFQQIVYGLMDLGYRSAVPVTDLLADKDGSIALEGQFFEGSEILTSHPVTVTDYRILVLDNFPSLKNVWIEPIRSSYLPRGFYGVFLELRDDLKEKHLLVDEDADGVPEIDRSFLGALEEDVAKLLNSHRNLCEYFLPPTTLRPKPIYLGGDIHLKRDCEARAFIEDLAFEIQGRAFPNIPTCDYRQMKRDGLRDDQIFDGPKVKNGYVKREHLRDKTSDVFLDDIASRFSKIDGLAYVNGIAFYGEDGERLESERVGSAYDEILFFPDPLSVSFETGYHISFFKNGVHLDTSTLDLGEAGYANNQKYIKSVATSRRSYNELKRPIPGGEYRDLTAYSSVQNTFPSIYGVGPTDFFKTASEKRRAQSKQLRGFLLLFDQLIANSFSQLANIGRLFSFGETKKKAEKSKSRSKSVKARRVLWGEGGEEEPTYFYQPLYETPGAKDLLKGVEKFVCPGEAGAKTAFDDALAAYQEEAYNPYILGLEHAARHREKDLERKKRFLDHQLGRLGESIEEVEPLRIGADHTMFLEDEIERRRGYLTSYAEISSERSKARPLPGAKVMLKEIQASDKGVASSEREALSADGFTFSGFEKKMDSLLGIGAFFEEVVESLIRKTRDEDYELADSFDSSRVDIWRVVFDESSAVKRIDGKPCLKKAPLAGNGVSVTVKERDALIARIESKRFRTTADRPYLLAMAEEQFTLLIEDSAAALEDMDELTGNSRNFKVDIAKTTVLKTARELLNLNTAFKGFVFIETTPLLRFSKYQLTACIRSRATKKTTRYQSEEENLGIIFHIVRTMEDQASACSVDFGKSKTDDGCRVHFDTEQAIVRSFGSNGELQEHQLKMDQAGATENWAEEWKELGGRDSAYEFSLNIRPTSDALSGFADFGHKFPMGAHLFFPNWVARFAESSMRRYLREWTRKNAPSHLKTKVSFLNFEDMTELLRVHQSWTECIEKTNTSLGGQVTEETIASNNELVSLLNRLSSGKA